MLQDNTPVQFFPHFRESICNALFLCSLSSCPCCLKICSRSLTQSWRRSPTRSSPSREQLSLMWWSTWDRTRSPTAWLTLSLLWVQTISSPSVTNAQGKTHQELQQYCKSFYVCFTIHTTVLIKNKLSVKHLNQFQTFNQESLEDF